MSNDVILRAEGLGKKFIIGHEAERERYVTLRDVLARTAKGLLRSTMDLARGKAIVQGDTTEEFWALKDVNFEIKRGEVVGIIGRNGAGKSTLLKVLSRITEPSEGRVTINGRVASLLEVGTGFHPELSGRENIFLNGAILGMTRAEIKRKFDEIVDFAEIEKFLDTPVKRYSSGMYVRLAFAVAAHLEPEILVVDEVLAVGDADFQKKCLGKMSEVAGGGRTVLFVSHNMDAVRRICVSGILMASGQVERRGPVEECIEGYFSKVMGQQRDHVIEFADPMSGKARVSHIEMLDKAGAPLAKPRTWDPVTFRIHFTSKRHTPNASAELFISTMGGTLLTRCSVAPMPLTITEGENYVDCEFPRLELSKGSFVIGAALSVPGVEFLYYQPHAATLEIGSRDVFNSGDAPTVDRYPVPMDHAWHIPGAETPGSKATS